MWKGLGTDFQFSLKAFSFDTLKNNLVVFSSLFLPTPPVLSPPFAEITSNMNPHQKLCPSAGGINGEGPTRLCTADTRDWNPSGNWLCPSLPQGNAGRQKQFLFLQVVIFCRYLKIVVKCHTIVIMMLKKLTKKTPNGMQFIHLIAQHNSWQKYWSVSPYFSIILSYSPSETALIFRENLKKKVNNKKGFLPFFSQKQGSLQLLVTMQGNHLSRSVTSKLLMLLEMCYFWNYHDSTHCQDH